MHPETETIVIGQLMLKFLLGAADTDNRVTMFEFTIPPGAKVPAPHYHLSVDEILYGLDGVTTTVVNGNIIETGAGDRLFIKRGDIHQHDNKHEHPARTLCVLTPADIGIDYFRALSALVIPEQAPDAAKVSALMAQYGLIVSNPTA